MLKYLGAKGHDICNNLSKKYVYMEYGQANTVNLGEGYTGIHCINLVIFV